MLYTKKGDCGQSSVINNENLPKNSVIFDVLGTLDELCANLGNARLESCGEISDVIFEIQNQLIDVMGILAGAETKFDFKSNTLKFEKLIDKYDKITAKTDGFCVCAKTKLGALLHISRTVCRRAERHMISMKKTIPSDALCYINRLSDLIYILALFADDK